MVGYALPEDLPRKPSWLQALLAEKFFTTCADHSSVRKNERNVFCVDCRSGICQHCLCNHLGHHLLQIRRYVYQDVIRLQDIQNLVDCRHVQPYIINSARVVFLNQRPQPRQSKLHGNTCLTCQRTLQEAYRYCSVACKVRRKHSRFSVDAIFTRKQRTLYSSVVPHCSSKSSSRRLYIPYETQSFGARKGEFEDLSPSSTLYQPPSRTSSGSTAVADALIHATSSSTSSLQPPKKARSSLTAPSSTTTLCVSHMRRRKSTPHRSPLY